MKTIKPVLPNFRIFPEIFMNFLNTRLKGKSDKKIYQNAQFLQKWNLIFKISAIIVMLTASAFTIMAQEVMDTAGVKDLVANYQKVLNTRNTKDLGKFFSEDADIVFGNLMAAQGREAIEALWQNYFSRQEKERRGRFDIVSIKFLTPVAALINIASTTGIADDQSTFRKARHALWLGL